MPWQVGICLIVCSARDGPNRKSICSVKACMRSDAQVHVPPILLWQSLCGGGDLPKRDYQHIITCLECETLAKEINDALDDIENALDSHRVGPS